MTVNAKVKAGGQGASAAGALSVVVVWALGELGLDMPPEVAAGLATVIAAGASVAAGYAKTG